MLLKKSIYAISNAGNAIRSLGFVAAIAMGFLPVALSAQTYSDSLSSYRQKYREDMFKIIGDDTANLSFYTARKNYRVPADIVLLQDQKPFPMTTSSGKTKEAVAYATLDFVLNGQKCRLLAYQLIGLQAKEPEHLFVPFTDRTSGRKSYGGGRYIDLSLSDADTGKKIWIDFNKAYNPYCAFTSGYNCPIPPSENRLPVAIKAGQSYRGGKLKPE